MNILIEQINCAGICKDLFFEKAIGVMRHQGKIWRLQGEYTERSKRGIWLWQVG